MGESKNLLSKPALTRPNTQDACLWRNTLPNHLEFFQWALAAAVIFYALKRVPNPNFGYLEGLLSQREESTISI